MLRLLARDHRVQSQGRIRGFRFGDYLDARLRLLRVDFVDEVTVVSTKADATRRAVSVVRQRRHTNHPTVTDHR